MNRISRLLPVCVLIVMSVMNVSADTGEMADFQAAIRAKYDLKEQAFADGTAEPILTEFYSEDVVSVDNEGNTHRGREELRPLYEETTKFANVRVESVNTKVSGDMGWDWANFYVTPKDPAEKPFSFKILFLWERIDGKWWCAGDMYTNGLFETAE